MLQGQESEEKVEQALPSLEIIIKQKKKNADIHKYEYSNLNLIRTKKKKLVFLDKSVRGSTLSYIILEELENDIDWRRSFCVFF